MRQYCQGVRTSKKHYSEKGWKTPETDALNHSNKFCHPANDDEQQLQHQQCSNTQSSSSGNTWQVYTNTYSYVVQQRTTQ